MSRYSCTKNACQYSNEYQQSSEAGNKRLVTFRFLFAILVIGLALAGTAALAPRAASANSMGQHSTLGSCIAGSLVSSPSPGSGDNRLLAISASSDDDAWAVGNYVDGGVSRTLITHWDGTQWNAVSSPNAGSFSNYLYAVSAIANNDVWASGYYFGDRASQTLTMHWDGVQWSVVDSPNVGQLNNSLKGIVAISANDVWAVGYYRSSNNVDQTLSMHWDGMQWSVVNSPDVGSSINRLFAVTAVSPDDVWAVGNYSYPSNGSFLALTLHWDGTQWNDISSPNPGSEYNLPIAVTAIAPNDVWAVGFYTAGAGNPIYTLTMHWDGSQWNVVSSPNSNLTSNYLYGIAANAPNDVWAVGYYYNNVGQAPSQTLAMHWDGGEWSLLNNPNPGSTTNTLEAVAATSPGSALTVGYYQSGNTNPLQTLALSYADECTTPTAIPTATATMPTSTPPSTPTTLPTGTSTATSSSTPTSTLTSMATSTLEASPTHMATATSIPTATLTSTPTVCAINFSDVHSADYFYTSVGYLYCGGVISGYSDGTFRPFNNATRGQVTKIVVLALGWTPVCPASPHFSDVPRNSIFYCFIETALSRGIISGYSDGTFHPESNITRGQLSKVVVLAMNWVDPCPANAHFSDVAPGNPFFCFVETAYAHGTLSGYSDGTFRPGSNATRGQISKIVYQAVTGP